MYDDYSENFHVDYLPVYDISDTRPQHTVSRSANIRSRSEVAPVAESSRGESKGCGETLRGDLAIGDLPSVVWLFVLSVVISLIIGAFAVGKLVGEITALRRLLIGHSAKSL